MTKKDLIPLEIDLDLMTMRDYLDFEEIVGETFEKAMVGRVLRDPMTGVPFKDPENPGRPLRESDMSMKVMYAHMYIALRRQNKALTRDEVMDYKLSDYDLKFKEPDDEDPKSEADNAPIA